MNSNADMDILRAAKEKDVQRRVNTEEKSSEVWSEARAIRGLRVRRWAPDLKHALQDDDGGPTDRTQLHPPQLACCTGPQQRQLLPR
jgi:hypothetical protein